MKAKRSRRTRTQAYEDVLVNIMKRAGVGWKGKRVFHDPSQVAEDVIKKYNPELFDKLDGLPYERVVIKKDGSWYIQRPLKRAHEK